MALSATSRLLLGLARLTAFAGVLSTVVLWIVFMFFNPYYSPDQSFDLGPYAMATMMILLAAAVAWAVVNVKPLILFGAFVGSFMPMGFYVLLTPGVFSWIGVANLLYLVALLLILGARLVSAIDGRIREERP